MHSVNVCFIVLQVLLWSTNHCDTCWSECREEKLMPVQLGGFGRYRYLTVSQHIDIALGGMTGVCEDHQLLLSDGQFSHLKAQLLNMFWNKALRIFWCNQLFYVQPGSWLEFELNSQSERKCFSIAYDWEICCIGILFYWSLHTP